MNGLVYLAGPMSGLTPGDATDWRRWVSWELAKDKIKTLSPMRDTDLMDPAAPIRPHGYDGFLIGDRAALCRDLLDIKRADVIVVNFLDAKRPSLGTAWEIGAARMADKPIVVCCEAGNIHEHALLKESAGYLVVRLEDAVECVKTLMGV